MWPGYEVVKRQHEEAVTVVPVVAVKVSDDRRVVDVTVPPQSSTDTFAVTLRTPEVPESPEDSAAGIDHRSWPSSLHGVEVELDRR